MKEICFRILYSMHCLHILGWQPLYEYNKPNQQVLHNHMIRSVKKTFFHRVPLRRRNSSETSILRRFLSNDEVNLRYQLFISMNVHTQSKQNINNQLIWAPKQKYRTKRRMHFYLSLTRSGSDASDWTTACLLSKVSLSVVIARNSMKENWLTCAIFLSVLIVVTQRATRKHAFPGRTTLPKKVDPNFPHPSAASSRGLGHIYTHDLRCALRVVRSVDLRAELCSLRSLHFELQALKLVLIHAYLSLPETPPPPPPYPPWNILWVIFPGPAHLFLISSRYVLCFLYLFAPQPCHLF